MTVDEARRTIAGLAFAGRVRFSRHARQRMAQRGMTEADVLHALRNAARCTAGDQAGIWKVTGPDLDDDDLTAVVEFDPDVFVITVY